MAFQQGLSGLNASAKALDVVSNNIANAATVGFKGAQAHFSDLFASALSGGSSAQVGIGVKLGAVQQTFTQGNITVSNNPLDIAINGNGFFRVQMSQADQSGYYTRNGQFHLDKNGLIVNSNGSILTGYMSYDGTTVDTASVQPITLGTGGIPPKQTGWSSTVDPANSGLKLSVNLDNRDKKAVNVTDPNWTPLTPFAWDSTFSTGMYNYSTSATVYDQSGAAHTLTNYYVRQEDTGPGARTWAVYTALDNKYMLTDTTNPPELVFQPNGVIQGLPSDYRFPLDMTQSTDIETGAPVDLTTDLEWFDPAVTINLDMGESTQYGSPNDTREIVQDGYGAGMLTRVTVDEQGFVQGNYSNGQTKIMGQVILAEFRNPNGLQNVGNNLWVETNASGQPLIGAPGAGTKGLLQSGAVEESNIDLTQELVNMITMQRNYQANAQSIKTQDQILQTMVNLR
ncbi:MAG: flagellar hook protein FlgE [Azovibrio sp.]|uniref:flagellar hook protein FlgE n=1 Tax=Azovibrio sp. TaxID=1872673 RepID=UPI003C751946